MENKDNNLQEYKSDEVHSSQTNGEASEVSSNKKRKLSGILTVLLFVALICFAGSLLMKWFWISNIGVSGISMKPNYNLSDDRNDVVWVNKTITPKRGDVIVFYSNSTPTGWKKFMGEFARGDEEKEDGDYEKWIKRVVAVEGDSIWWEKVDDKRCVLYIKTADGRILQENAGDNKYYRHGEQAKFYTLSGDGFSTTPYFSIPTPPDQNGNDTNTLYSHDSEANAWTIPQNYVFVMGDNRNVGASYDSRYPDVGAVLLKKLYGVVINP